MIDEFEADDYAPASCRCRARGASVDLPRRLARCLVRIGQPRSPARAARRRLARSASCRARAPPRSPRSGRPRRSASSTDRTRARCRPAVPGKLPAPAESARYSRHRGLARAMCPRSIPCGAGSTTVSTGMWFAASPGVAQRDQRRQRPGTHHRMQHVGAGFLEIRWVSTKPVLQFRRGVKRRAAGTKALTVLRVISCTGTIV